MWVKAEKEKARIWLLLWMEICFSQHFTILKWILVEFDFGFFFLFQVTNHTWQSMKARFRLIATRLNQYIHLDPAIKDLMNFLQSRSKAKVWEKSPDKIMKKNIDLFRDLESTSSEEEGVSCPQPKKLKAGEGPNRDCAGSPRLDPPSGAQDTGKDGKTVASTTNRLQNCRESSSETISNPETVQEALEHDRQPESQGSNASIDSILFDLRSKSVNLKEFLKRHKDPKFGGKNPDILKCVAVERKYEPCKCHPTRIDRRDRMAELMPPALGEPSPGWGACLGTFQWNICYHFSIRKN